VACYDVYLEIAGEGRCLAHVPALPGCNLRAPTRQEALLRLPQAIREYLDWLRRHAEPAPPSGEEIRIEIADESTGFGPFEPGSAAALFPPDREPVPPDEMERHFRLMAHSRADLLAVVRHLPDDLLDWQPDTRSFTIRVLLRHVGNAEEWYVSRLVPPETLPADWQHDEDLPIFEFLAMERRTAVSRLRQLTAEERAGVVYPTAWTDHPEEAWTLRKTLRRFLEHEWEHLAQVHEILDARRSYLNARLAAERAGLLEQLLGLDRGLLIEAPVVETWTVGDLLAHLAAWDRWEHTTMRCLAAGKAPDLAALEDLDATNAAWTAQWRGRTATLSAAQTLDQALADFHAARTGWLAWLETLSQEELFRQRSHQGDDWSFHSVPIPVQWEHDAEHAAQIAAWRASEGLGSRTGPKAVLEAAIAAARDGLLKAAALVPAGERASRPVCGHWTLKDVLGHLADWESFGAEGLHLMAQGQPPPEEPIGDVDGWNENHARARRNQSWEEVWRDLHAAHRALSAGLQEISEADLGRTFPFPWGPAGTAYQWVCVYVGHDREHARDLLSTGPLPEREGT
jgi:predicted RNase H-like HicB family nuclease/uncharacterized damage-inducible protein DinB